MSEAIEDIRRSRDHQRDRVKQVKKARNQNADGLVFWRERAMVAETALSTRAKITQEELDLILEEHELMRKTLTIIAGNAGDRLQETQARGALANIGPALSNGER